MADGVPIGPGTRVKLHFALRLASGAEVDSTGNRAAEFTVGDGNLLPGFERALFGLKAGDKRNLKIPADAAFGESRRENIQRLPRASFSAEMELEEGLVVSFADSQKSELPGVVTAVDEQTVEVDFNHPLAGRDVEFDVDIIDVRQVSNEIVRTGKL